MHAFASVVNWLSFVALTAAGPGCTDKGAASDTYQTAFAFGFAPDIITVGTCYFKRLVAKGFTMTNTSVIPQPTEDPDLLPAKASSPEQQSYIAKELSWQLDAMAWFCLVHLTCICLASKFLHTVPCGLLDIAEYVCDRTLELELVRDLELECLQALEWQLHRAEGHGLS